MTYASMFIPGRANKSLSDLSLEFCVGVEVFEFLIFRSSEEGRAVIEGVGLNDDEQKNLRIGLGLEWKNGMERLKWFTDGG